MDPTAKAEELKALGNSAFSDAKYFEAIDHYTKAIEIDAKNHILYSNRSASYAMLDIGPEALADGLKCVELKPEWSKGYSRVAAAYLILQELHAARQAFMQGLKVDAENEGLLKGLSGVEEQIKVLPRPGKELHRLSESSDDFECTVCMRLFWEPCTTACGHTYCRTCLGQIMAHDPPKCALCRAPLHLNARTHPANTVLTNIIKRNFPKEYEAREREAEAECQSDQHGGDTNRVPLVAIGSVVLPGATIATAVYDPTHRTVIRRCMEGDRRFGLVHQRHADVGCLLEVVRHSTQADGVPYIEARAVRRFRVERRWDTAEGHLMASVAWLDDLWEGIAHEQIDTAHALALQCRELFESMFVPRLRADAQGRAALQRAGDPPPESPIDPPAISWWIASALSLQTSAKQRLLESTSPLARLRDIHDLLMIGSGSAAPPPQFDPFPPRAQPPPPQQPSPRSQQARGSSSRDRSGAPDCRQQ